jgi:hypothetical protein
MTLARLVKQKRVGIVSAGRVHVMAVRVCASRTMPAAAAENHDRRGNQRHGDGASLSPHEVADCTALDHNRSQTLVFRRIAVADDEIDERRGTDSGYLSSSNAKLCRRCGRRGSFEHHGGRAR